MDVVAAAVGIAVNDLRACEDGHGLSAPRIAQIAALYGFSEQDLLDGALEDSAVSVLLRGDPAANELILHLGRFAAICHEQTVLEDLLGMSARGRVAGFAPAGIPTLPAHKQGEDLARRTRELLQLGIAPIRSMSGLLLELGIRLVWTDRLSEDVYGLSLHDPTVGPSVIANFNGRKQQWWTLRSTLAHELCHVLYDRVPAAPLGIASRRDQRGDVEQRANAFGVHFLAPRVGIQQLLMDRGARPYELDRTDVHAVMMHFGFGKDAATWHLKHLDWITESQRVSLVQKRYPTEPEDDVESPHAQPDLRPFIELGVPWERLGLVRPAVTAYGRGLITLGRLREALGLDPFVDVRAALDPLDP